MPIVQTILLVVVSFAVFSAVGTYLFHQYRLRPRVGSSFGADEGMSSPYTEADVAFDALARTPCVVCCFPVGDEPMQRDDGRWCCAVCAGIPTTEDDDVTMIAHGVLSRLQSGNISEREMEDQIMVVRSALRMGADAKIRQRELLAVITAYQLIVHRLEGEEALSERVLLSIATARDVERAMGIDDNEPNAWSEQPTHVSH